MSSLAFAPKWAEVLIKYDPRHWMGNWFLMAQFKSSALFKYFCTATSDAMFEVREGERDRVKQHLRKLFKRIDLVDPRRWQTLSPDERRAEIERVDGLIPDGDLRWRVTSKRVDDALAAAGDLFAPDNV